MSEAKVKVGDQWFYRGNRSNVWLATSREPGTGTAGGLADRVPSLCWPLLEEIARLQHDVSRGMANHNADLNNGLYVPEGPKEALYHVINGWPEPHREKDCPYCRPSTNAAPQVSPRSSEGESTTADREPAEAALDNDKLNAARYRWLRDHSIGTKPEIGILYAEGMESAWVSEEGELDSVIDCRISNPESKA